MDDDDDVEGQVVLSSGGDSSSDSGSTSAAIPYRSPAVASAAGSAESPVIALGPRNPNLNGEVVVDQQGRALFVHKVYGTVHRAKQDAANPRLHFGGPKERSRPVTSWPGDWPGLICTRCFG